MKVLEEIFPKLYNSFFEAKFIIKGTTWWYYGQDEYRIDGFREFGTDNLSIEVYSNINLDDAKNKVLVFLKYELTKMNIRIVHSDIFSSFIGALSNCISRTSDYYCICGKPSSSGLSFAYDFLLISKDNYHQFDDQYAIMDEGIKKYPIIDMLVRNAYKGGSISEVFNCTVADIIGAFQLPLVSEINFFSTLKYEGEENHSILYFPSSQDRLITKSIFFDSVIELSKNSGRQVRKVMEMSNEKFALLVEHNKIKALCSTDNLQSGCKIKFMGNRSWILTIDNKSIFSYENGNYVFSFQEKENDILPQAIKTQFSHLSLQEQDRIEYVIKIACTQRHGTSIIVFEDARIEIERLYGLDRGIKIEAINLFECSEFIERITSIDGAIFMDKSCSCSFIGALVDGTSISKGNPARGARYNSIYNYIALKAKENIKCMGVIISEDGMVDTVCSNEFIE